MQLKNQVALITGGGRGIGRAIALAYAREGAHLALAARTLNELEETAQEAQKLGARTCVIPADMTDQARVDSMVRQTLDAFSTIDILVNNAGIIGPLGPLQDNDVSTWRRAIEVNLIGVFLCCRAVLPVMLRQDRGKIINMSGGSSRSSSAYGASKAAVVSLTRDLSSQLQGTNVQVNVMSPGSIHTRMWEETRDAAGAIGDTELYEYGRRITSGGGASIERAAQLAVFLGAAASNGLSGRLFQAVTDDLDAIPPRIAEIMASDAYTMRRVELP